jgi:hypothetical protein
VRTVFVIVIHRVHDRAGFETAQGKAVAAGLPQGVAFPAQATSPDHRLRISLCRGASVTAVRNVLEGAIGEFADSEYYEMTLADPQAPPADLAGLPGKRRRVSS